MFSSYGPKSFTSISVDTLVSTPLRQITPYST